jgi:hypothetical protein
MNPECDFKALLEALNSSGVRFVVIGGLAATLHGSARSTVDLDICYSRAPEELQKLAELLKSIHAYPRGIPTGLPFKLDARTLKSGLNFTFDTDFGPFDMLGEMEGVGTFEDVIGDAPQKRIYGLAISFLSLPKLIKAKTIAGRPKDLAAVEELNALLKIQQSTGPAGDSL